MREQHLAHQNPRESSNNPNRPHVKDFSLGFLTGSVVLPLAVIGYLSSGLADVRSDASVPRWAARLMYSSIHASVRRAAPRLQNPFPASDETLIAGGKLYLTIALVGTVSL